MSETQCGRTGIHAGERVFAKPDERLSSRYSCRRCAGGDGETVIDMPSPCAKAGFTGSDEDRGNQRTSQRAERAIRQSACARASEARCASVGGRAEECRSDERSTPRVAVT
jgi:hypothetical protein